MKNKNRSARANGFYGQAAIERKGKPSTVRPLRKSPALPPRPHPVPAMRGQAAIENLIMVGFALAFILPLAFLFMSSTGTENSKTSIAQAKISARTIADEAGQLYLQGPGAKKTILVNYPDGVLGTSATNGLIVLTVSPEPDRTLDITATSFAELRSSAVAGEEFSGKRNAGLQRIRIEVVHDGTDGKDYAEIGYEK